MSGQVLLLEVFFSEAARRLGSRTESLRTRKVYNLVARWLDGSAVVLRV